MTRSAMILAGAALALFAISGCCGKYKDQIAEQENTISQLQSDKKGLEQTKLELETKLSSLQDYNQALQDETVRKRITDQGDEPGGGTAEQLGETVKRDHARWGEVVKANNIRVE